MAYFFRVKVPSNYFAITHHMCAEPWTYWFRSSLIIPSGNHELLRFTIMHTAHM